MTRPSAFLAFVLILVILSACNRVSTRIDTAPEAGFAPLKTYAWVPRKTGGNKNFSEAFLFTDQKVREAVERELAARGFRKVSPGDGPDFWVQYYLWAEEGVAGGHPYPSPGRAYRSMDTLDTYAGRHGRDVRMGARDVQRGTLTVTVNEDRTRKEIWRGSAEARVKDRHNPQQVARLIDEAVRRIFHGFPPKSEPR